MPGISPTTLFVAGSISITLSPAALVCTIRTEAAWTAADAARRASARESLVFIATHFKLPSHVADPLFDSFRASGLGARLHRVQGQDSAAARGKAAWARTLHHLPFDRDRLPPAAAAEGPQRLHRRGDAQEFRRGLAVRAARRPDEEPPAGDAARARGRRHRVPPGRQALGFAERSRVEDARRVGDPREVMPPFRYYLRVRYIECDAQKVVFNSRYGEYVDVSINEFLRATGMLAEFLDGHLDFQLVKQTTEWKAPARFDQVLELSIAVTRLGTTSFTVRTDFRIAGDDRVVVNVETVYVLVDARTLTKMALPDRLRAALQDGAAGRVTAPAG